MRCEAPSEDIGCNEPIAHFSEQWRKSMDVVLVTEKWSALRMQLVITHLPWIYGTRWFIGVSTIAHHRTVPWLRWTQSTTHSHILPMVVCRNKDNLRPVIEFLCAHLVCCMQGYARVWTVVTWASHVGRWVCFALPLTGFTDWLYVTLREIHVSGI
jgi:hypothetical protein